MKPPATGSLSHRLPRVYAPGYTDRFLVLPSSFVSQMPQFAPAAYSVTAVFLWGASDFAGGFASRRANAFVLTAFSHLCAFVLMVAIALTQHGPFPNLTRIF